MKNRSNFPQWMGMLLAGVFPAVAQDYTTCKTWAELIAGKNIRYAQVTRVSDPGPRERPAYTGVWFYDVQQFDASGRYMLGMKVSFEGRAVTPEDRGEIGYIDLRDGNKWTKIGETTAWNWQQGCRLQWRPGSDEVIWNDRADDGASFVCRAYDFKTGARRTLPRAIYDVSRDGKSALTHDFQRMKHGGTGYAPMPDRFAGQRAPAESGIERMDMATGQVTFLVSLQRMAEIAYPQGYQEDTDLYFFREGWNPSGTRFIAFVKNAGKPVTTRGWSISADGRDVRFFYESPSHHTWQDDNTILEGSGLKLYRDDGTGRVAERLVEMAANADPTILPGSNGAWVLGDTYGLDGFQQLFLFHRPSGLFVPLARLKSTAPEKGIHRVDLHARTNRNGRVVSVDASHEGLGRQMYIVPIGHILDHPPAATGRATKPPTVK